MQPLVSLVSAPDVTRLYSCEECGWKGSEPITITETDLRESLEDQDTEIPETLCRALNASDQVVCPKCRSIFLRRLPRAPHLTVDHQHAVSVTHLGQTYKTDYRIALHSSNGTARLIRSVPGYTVSTIPMPGQDGGIPIRLPLSFEDFAKATGWQLA